MTTPIRQTLLRLLARRDHSLTELRQKLQLKGFLPTDIEPALESAIQSGWVKEDRYIESYIHARSAKGYGPLRIQQELRQKGITDEKIAEQLDIADNAWFSAAKRVWQKQSKGHYPKDFRERAKQLRFLQYRGFTQEQIEQTLSSKDD